MTTAIDIESAILEADARGAPYRLEYVRGRLKIEASPASRHQMAAKRIERSIMPSTGGSQGQPGSCACYSLQDVLLRFPDSDGSLKRPDIAIFCAEPPERDQALEMIPEVVIEILSIGYEDKDLGPDGAAFYLAWGVQEVIVVDPRADTAIYSTQTSSTTLSTPARITLQCGCVVTV